MIKFEQYIDLKNINDSNELDSGQPICELTIGNKIAWIQTCGEVNIDYKGECYRTASEMPKELLQLIHNGTYWNNDDVYVDENNWFELFWGEDDTLCPSSECVDVERYTPDQLLSLCLEVLND